MRLCVLTLLLLATAVYKAASQMTVCSLPSRKLYIVIDSTLVSCVASKSSSARCLTACSCRWIEIGRSTYGVCLNNSATFNCDDAENAIRCKHGEEQTPSAAIVAVETTSNSNSIRVDLKPWQWVLIGLAVALLVGLLLFSIIFFKNRPLRGDNRREVAQTLDHRPEPKDDVNLLPIVPCKNQVRTATSNPSITRSHNTNPSQTSGFSGGIYRTNAGNQMSSTLTDTEIVTQHQERVFSPISASPHSARSSDYSEGLETSTISASPREPDRRPYASRSSYSLSSDMGSFSSQLTSDGLDTETGERAPPRKSIEF